MSVIVAAATPLAPSALAVVRLSGDDAFNVALRVLRPRGVAGSGVPRRRPVRVDLLDDEGVLDDGVALFMPGPNTATGEDLVEVTCHGNPVVVEHFIEACVAAGAVLAERGDFTRRAVMHGKLDLVAAEGVRAAIEASGRAGLAVARQALDGRHRGFYDEVRDGLCAIAAELEARLDLPGDTEAAEDDDAVTERLIATSERCRTLAGTESVGRRLVDGARVALVGAVNAGKSSLFNALVGRTRALVHDQAGTTRDVLEVRTSVAGVPITLLDTAGERTTDDPVEAAGLALARELVDEADLLVVVLRGPRSAAETQILERVADRAHLIVTNGVDEGTPDDALGICVSASTGHGIDDLASQIRSAVAGADPGQLIIASARQRDELRRIALLCDEAIEALPIAGAAVAADFVTEAVGIVDDVTGADPRESVLDAVFSRFCIGK